MHRCVELDLRRGAPWSMAARSSSFNIPPDTERIGRWNRAAGNGIFERGDWSLQKARETASFSGDRKNRIMSSKIPGGTASFRARTVSPVWGRLNGVCAVRYEPVSDPK